MRARVYPAVESTQPEPVEPLTVLRHRWWLVAVATLLGLAAGGGWAVTSQPVWESTTSVLVHPAGQDTNVVGGRTQGQVNLDTEAQLVRSTAVAAGAAGLLDPTDAAGLLDPTDAAGLLDPAGEPAPGPGHRTPEELARSVTVEVPPNTSVLLITFAAATPAQAQAGSRAFAQAYLQHREQTAQAELTAQMAAIDAKIDELHASLNEINERFAETLPGTAAEANLESRRGTVISQLHTMTGRLDELATATVTAGTVISDARLPARPSRPEPALVLASGAAAGLVLGVGAAGLAERLARRVRRPGDVSRRLGLPVLAALNPATAPWPTGRRHRRAGPGTDEIATPYSPAGRAFDRLRNEVIAADPPAPGAGGRVIVVTSAAGRTTASLTAANLAASLSRSGHDVILIGAQAPEANGGALTRLLGVAGVSPTPHPPGCPAPGLSEVLAGRVPVSRALQRSPRQPRLLVMTMGATATATGLLQSPALGATLATLVGQARYVVVDAPPTSASADAQSLASQADTALLVVERRRARFTDVADAAEQLRRVGTPPLGVVVVPPLRPDRERAAAPQPPVTDGTDGTDRDGAADERRARLRPYPPASADQTVVIPRVTGEEPPDAEPDQPELTSDDDAATATTAATTTAATG